MDNILDLTKENIQEVVNASLEKIVVLAFWSPQEPESVALVQQLEQLQQDRFILAKVSYDEEPEIAGYFRIQALPTVMVLSQGQPVDALVGPQDAAALTNMLDKHLPPMWQLQLEQAMEILANQPEADELARATNLLLQAQIEHPNDEINLALADAYLQGHDLSSARALLEKIGLADQNSYYQNLLAKLKLAEEAADTPEIRDLQQKFIANPDDVNLRIDLAKALHQSHRNEEALELLFEVMKQDMTAGNGNLKQTFLDILTAIGQGNSLANQYRRKLYSLLY